MTSNTLYKNLGGIQFEVVEKGNHAGFRYAIVTYGSHPCGYVEVPEGHPCRGKFFDDVNIECHGGITFAGDMTDRLGYDYCIGFDCNHYGDCAFPANGFNAREGHIWTVDEMKAELRDICDQLAVYSDASADDEPVWYERSNVESVDRFRDFLIGLRETCKDSEFEIVANILGKFNSLFD